MELLDASKVLVLMYILSLNWIDTKHVAFASHHVIKILWIVAIGVVFIIYDIVLAVIMAIALIITLLKIGATPSVPSGYTPHDSKYAMYAMYERMEQAKPVVQKQQPLHVEPEPQPHVEPVPSQHIENIQDDVHFDDNDVHNDVHNDVLQKNAQLAIEKYVVDDLLKKASEDAFIPENRYKYPALIGGQFNIQGIEKNMTGYNFK